MIQSGERSSDCVPHSKMKIGSIASLHRYPVKSMMGEELLRIRNGFHVEGDPSRNNSAEFIRNRTHSSRFCAPRP